jgi:hypothetical protein
MAVFKGGLNKIHGDLAVFTFDRIFGDKLCHGGPYCSQSSTQ